MDSLVVVHASPAATIGSYRNVGLWHWRLGATPALLDDLNRVVAAVAKANPEGGGMLTIIERAVTVPDDAIRKRFVKIRRDGSISFRGGAVVYEGDGLRGAVVRGVVTGLMLMAPETYPQAVFGDLTSGIGWLGKKLGPKLPDPIALAKAMTELRRRGV